MKLTRLGWLAWWLPLSLAACDGGATQTVTELTVRMDVAVPLAGAAFTGKQTYDLSAEDEYKKRQGSFRCAGFDVLSSHLELVDDGVAADLGSLSLAVDVAREGETLVTPLATFQGALVAGERVPMDDARFTIHQGGVNRMAEVALSTSPVFDAWFAAEVGEPRTLTLETRLAVYLSDSALVCPD